MTHSIEQWRRPSQVIALQTSRTLNNQSNQIIEPFDIHPNQAKASAINALVSIYDLPHQPIFMQQVHKNMVVEYNQPPQKHFMVKADACYTRTPGVICAVMTADCLPILLTDIEGSFVAAVHCGWRSLCADILAETIHAIKPTNEVQAWLGPCIQQKQYEVEESFVSHYLKQHPDSTEAFTSGLRQKFHACIPTMAQHQLNKLGINLIQGSKICTFLDHQYYSWRENKTSHRMSTMAWIKQHDT